MEPPYNEPEEELISWLRAPLAKAISSPFGNIVSLGTRVGKGRPANQDRLLVARFPDAGGQPTDVVAVCDGMGGMESGERCAELGIANFVVSLGALVGLGRRLGEALQEAAQYANARVRERYHGEGGTTLTAVLLNRGQAWACTVGDTRLFGSGAAGFAQLSHDDTVAGALAEVHHHPKNSFDLLAEPEHLKLLQYVGMKGEIEPHVFSIDRPNKYRFLFICSDGAYRPPANLLPALAAEATSPRQLVERLCALAEFVGGADDASAVAIDARMIEERGQHEQPMRRTLQLWGPSTTQVATFLNFQPGSWLPYVQRRNVERRLYEPGRVYGLSFSERDPNAASGQKLLPPNEERPTRKGGKRKKNSPKLIQPLEKSGQVIMQVGPPVPLRGEEADDDLEHEESRVEGPVAPVPTGTEATEPRRGDH